MDTHEIARLADPCNWAYISGRGTGGGGGGGGGEGAAQANLPDQCFCLTKQTTFFA